ncbi:DUF1292 domain-containing protein [Clostridium massiliamazoniense]|uniref:DUF1292 domain-containing protein n=1 Tax=Clostridium massiliamazoniense TaxID=1347366 RepID=UPI0006D7A9E6|nr:DUF1292 domain-containing protein [Clostridium massiliamazoniense]
MQNDLETIVLMDEEGNEVEFRVVTKLDIEENEYFILSPSDDDEVVVAMKVVEDEEGNEGLVPVDNDFEIEMIEEAYSTIMSEE